MAKRRKTKTSDELLATMAAEAARVIDNDVVDEMEESFLAYAMSVITSRAIPDIRDGLKPVQRRILWAMHRMRITPDGPHKKSVRTAGEVVGKYHPHGDASVYAAMVRMAQDFSMRVPLVDGHGNFGSLDDGPASSRYTEARLAKAAMPMLEGLTEDAVDLRENFDGTEEEPTVLPAGFPNLLVNGVAGIAVGLATALPPHNLGEVCAATRHLLANPDATNDDLIAHLPAPDFPTGGIIVNRQEAQELYRTGRGKITVRAKAEITDVSARRRGIVITELPYTTSPNKVMEKVKELVADKRLPGIADIADYSDAANGLKIVVEARTGVDPQALLAKLYALTPLQENFSAQAVVLDADGQPITADLRTLLQGWINHRYDVLQRITRHRLATAEARAHLLRGVITALAAIDDVVAIIRSSDTTAQARAALIDRLAVDTTQADYILEMQLRRLAALEVKKVRDELAGLEATIADLTDLLGSHQRQTDTIDQALAGVAADLADPRQTALADGVDLVADKNAEVQVADEPCVVTVTANGTLCRHTADHQLSKGKRKMTGDVTALGRVTTTTRSKVLAVTDRGQGLWVDVVSLPDATSGSDPIDPSLLLADLADGETVIGLIDANPDNLTDDAGTYGMVTRNGTVKRSTHAALTVRGGEIIGLEDDTLLAVFPAPDDATILIVRSDGRVLATPAGKIRPQGRTAKGVAGIKLADDTVVVGAGVHTDTQPSTLITVTDGGKGKATPAADYPTKGRGGQGVRCHAFRKGDQRLAAAGIVPTDATAVLLVDGTGTKLAGIDGPRDGSGATLGAAVTEPATITWQA